jgi:C4-dicarboxylate-specific signal transduction histidine kinase
MGQALASVAAEQLRAVAQAMSLGRAGKVQSTSIPTKLNDAMLRADATLQAQIEALTAFAEPPTDGPISLADAVAWITPFTQRTTGHCKLKVLTDVSRQLPPVAGDYGAIQEILFALVSNACDAMASSASATLRIGAVQQDQLIYLVVQDDGPGVSSGVRKRAFDPFVTTRAKGDHLGLGLTVARELAVQMGGDLRYDPTSERGARFVLSLRQWRPARSRSSAGR